MQTTTIMFKLGARLDQYEVTPQQVNDIFAIIEKNADPAIQVNCPPKSLEEIETAISEYYGIKHIGQQCRKAEIVKARHMFFYLAGRHKKYSLQSIGFYLGKFDHTSVIHGRNKIKWLISGEHPNMEILQDINQINRMLGGYGSNQTSN